MSSNFGMNYGKFYYNHPRIYYDFGRPAVFSIVINGQVITEWISTINKSH